MEGTARYIEFGLYTIFSTRSPDPDQLKSHSSFKSFGKFHDFEIKKDPWLYLTEKTTYFYATGFNMAKLLDKLGICYKSKVFKEGQTTLQDLLTD